MNASNLVAWLLCLVLAFVATALAGINRGKTMVLDRKLNEVSDMKEVTATQVEVLREIKRLLSQMQKSKAKAGAANSEKKGLTGELESIDEKVHKLEQELPDSQPAP